MPEILRSKTSMMPSSNNLSRVPENNGRSLQAELKLILEEATRRASAHLYRAAYRVLADEVRAAVGNRPQSDGAELLAQDRRP